MQNMPATNTPEVFGLHANAEISYFVDNAKSIWLGLLKINIANNSGNSNDSAVGNLKEEALVATISEILDKMPERGLYFSPGTEALTPTQVVLAQVTMLFHSRNHIPATQIHRMVNPKSPLALTLERPSRAQVSTIVLRACICFLLFLL